MNIVTIINKLKEANMITTTEDGMKLFADCFNKFGISLLLLRDENKFSEIVEVLKENEIPIQKENGVYVLRIFAVDVEEMKNIISEFKACNELQFLRKYPEMIAEPKNIQIISKNIVKFQNEGKIYKDDNHYFLESLLVENHDVDTQTEPIEVMDTNNSDETVVEKQEAVIDDKNMVLKNYLEDKSLIDKILKNEANPGEEDVNIALELQKVENKICEDYLVIVDDGWKIVINNKEVNPFQEIKNTIETIIKLNLPISYHDALILVLFYKTDLNDYEIDEIIKKELFKEGN